MSTETNVLDITRTQLIQAPPARVMQAFFTDTDLKSWWGVTRSFIVARPLGLYAIEWKTTEFKDDVLGRLGGSFHGTIIDYRANGAFFLAETCTGSPRTVSRSARWRSKCTAARTATTARRW